MNDFTCPICRSARCSKTLPRSVGGEVVECAVCGHFALWPPPRHEEIAAWYDEYGSNRPDADGGAWCDYLEIQLLRKWDPRQGLSILDVGCGSGGLLKYCAKMGYRVTGIDIDKGRIDSLIQEGFRAYRKSLEKMTASAEQYDWVICKDVLEHLEDPLQSVTTLAHLVKQGGFMSISSPNGNAVAKHGKDTYALHVDKEHLHYLGTRQLVRLLKSLGFDLICEKFYPRASSFGRAHFRKASKRGNADRRLADRRHAARESELSWPRTLVARVPSRLRAGLRSIAQIVRRVASLDEILKGTAHEFVIIMRKSLHTDS